jgi:hypothetical protein
MKKLYSLILDFVHQFKKHLPLDIKSLCDFTRGERQREKYYKKFVRAECFAKQNVSKHEPCKKFNAQYFCYIFLSLSAPLYPDDTDDQNNQKRKITLNNFPISIFTPQTHQFSHGNGIQAVTGATGATGPATPCLLNFAMLRRTLAGLPGTGIASGDTGTFDDGFLYRITTNPTGSPSIAVPAESFTMEITGYYLIEFTYAGNQLITDPTNTAFYAAFNLLVNDIIREQFTLSTFGIRQIWQHIIFLAKGDVVSFQAASTIPFITPPVGIGGIDSFIMTINWIGPCESPD